MHTSNRHATRSLATWLLHLTIQLVGKADAMRMRCCLYPFRSHLSFHALQLLPSHYPLCITAAQGYTACKLAFWRSRYITHNSDHNSYEAAVHHPALSFQASFVIQA